MRLMLAALVVTATIAIVAAVFAIWPVVADAPWESEGGLPRTQDSYPCLRDWWLRNDLFERIAAQLDVTADEGVEMFMGTHDILREYCETPEPWRSR